MGKGLFGVDGEMASPPTKKSGSQKTKHLRSSRFLVVLKIRRQLLLTKASSQMVDKSWLTLIAGHPNDSDIWIDLAIPHIEQGRQDLLAKRSQLFYHESQKAR